MASVLLPERRGNCAGWHFFSPAHHMKLVEIVVAQKTSSETVALLQVLTKRIGKIGVTVGNCDGFVGNRMLNPYTSECVLLLAEGDATVESADKAILDFGMALGPFGMSDLAGNDIG
jgi:3-hydroxyacyl-CoA dehydrogenase